jgi:hypothetical protein
MEEYPRELSQVPIEAIIQVPFVAKPRFQYKSCLLLIKDHTQHNQTEFTP